jgi:hypothetical protein
VLADHDRSHRDFLYANYSHPIYRAFRRTVAGWTPDGLDDERRRLVRKGARRDDVDEQLLAAVNAALIARQEGTGR